MKMKLLVAGACVALVIGALGFKYEANSSQKKGTLSEQSQNIPDYAVYRQLFHHHMILKAKADEIEKQGKNGKALRSFYQETAGLSDDQARAFDRIAADCERDVARQDEKAKALIDSIRKNYPGGKVPAGQKPPEAPIELKAMQDDRNAIILNARDRLRAAFGEQEFKRFSDFVERDVKPNVTSEPANRQRPQTTMGPHRQLPAPVSKGARQP
jgi:hypothetical protein